MTKALLGKGLQYRIYDIGKGRVLKNPTTRFQKFFTLLQWGYIRPSNIRNSIIAAERITKEYIEGLQSSVRNLPSYLLGNPFFRENLCYEQDNATTLEIYFSQHGLEENKEVVDVYIENIIQLWSYGISDSVYNFTINNAVTKKGKVILIDLGELTFSKLAVIDQIAKQKWLHQWSYKHIIDDALKDYFKSKMRQYVTMTNLQKYWNN